MQKPEKSVQEVISAEKMHQNPPPEHPSSPSFSLKDPKSNF